MIIEFILETTVILLLFGAVYASYHLSRFYKKKKDILPYLFYSITAIFTFLCFLISCYYIIIERLIQ